MSNRKPAKPALPSGDAGGGSPRTAAELASTGPRACMPRWTAWAGFVLLQIAVVTSGMLVLHSLAGVAMPGCGAGSPCDLAANSKWGKVPGTDIPVSLLGLAFFVGLLQAWLSAVVGAGAGAMFKWVVRLGAVVSGAFVAVAITNNLICPYCMVTHGANLAFWAVVEAGARGQNRRVGPALVWGGVNLVVLALLLMRWQAVKGDMLAAAEKQRLADTQRIIDAGKTTPAPPTNGQATKPPTPPIEQTGPAAKPFTGRFHWGPAQAKARIVIFSDYQCSDCKRVEGEIRQLMAARNDVSVSAKHFPFCPDCNKYAPKLHDNACWAARAAEAAGMIGGDNAFWKMHQWLFDHNGVFNTNDDLRPAALAAGVDFDALVKTMTSEEPLARIKADVEEAWLLGMYRTPMVFINGVEMKGWMAGQAVGRTVEAVINAGAVAAGPENDHPPTALEKAVADWRENPRIPLQPRPKSWAQGPDTAPVRVVLFADDQMALTAEADAMARAALAKLPQGTAWRYEVRWFPFSRQCNPGVPAGHPADRPLACLAAKAAEAAGRVGGADAFWKMHAWLLANREKLSETSVKEAAGTLGLDSAAFASALNDPAVAAAISSDLSAAGLAQVQGVPIFVINDRQVRLWKMDDGRPVLPRIVEEAAAGR